MSLLSMLQDAAREIPITVPSVIVSANEQDTQRLLAFAHREGKELRSTYNWPQLQKEGTITTVSGQASYALPGDFERFIFNTEWDRTSHLEILGPQSPQAWQFRKSGMVSSSPRYRFRVKGVADKRVFIDPTPSSSGSTLVFEYISTNWILPITWTAGYTFLAGKYCSYNGNIYVTTLGGVSGSTPPTHTTGTASDGGISWTAFEGEYSKFLADTDRPVINEWIVGLGVQWRYLRANNLNYETRQAEWSAALKREVVGLTGAPVLSYGGQYVSTLIGAPNIPDTGYGEV